MKHFLFVRIIFGIFAFNLIRRCREDRKRNGRERRGWDGIGKGKAAYKAIGDKKHFLN